MLEKLTIAELLSLVNQIKGGGDEPASTFVGSFVIVRGRDSGVHAGVLASRSGQVVRLTGSRRLWQWQAARGIALSGVAAHGIVASGSKVDSPVDLEITDAIEVIQASAASRASIEAAS